ncbi:MAG: hypothetical protein EHM83_15185, partial [Burkholderiales bacterium]
VVLRHARVDWHDRLSGESATLRDVDVALGSVGRRHRASLRAPALLEVGEGVDAAIEFYRPAFSQLGDWRQWHGEAYVGADRVDLAALARRWQAWPGAEAAASRTGSPAEAAAAADSPAVAIGAGQARLRAWSHFERGAAVDALVRLAADGVEAVSRGRRLPLSALSVEARARRQADGSTAIEFATLRLDDDQGLPLPAAEEASTLVLARGGRPIAGRLSLGRFDAARVVDLARRLPVPDDLRSRLDALHLTGIVNRLTIDWAAAAAGDAASGGSRDRFGVDVAFEQLGFQRVEAAPRPGRLGMPGFANVSGTAQLTERGGSVLLSGEAAVLRFPGLFAEPEVPLDRLDAEASWTIGMPPTAGAAAPIDVHVEALRFANADARGEVSGRYRSGGKGAGIVDLRGRLDRADAGRTARYLPLGIPSRVRDWVRESVRAGRSDDVRFVLKGDLEDFPYRDPAAGEFRVDAKLADATLSYAPDWPAIERIQGRLRFERAGMEIDVETGKVWNVALAQTTARIAEFADPLLRVEGSGQGPAQDMVRFVNESPLLTRIDDFTRDVAIGGDATLQLVLEVPLGEIDATRVRGSVQFAGNHLSLDRTLPPFDGVAGRLEFTE